MTQSQLGYLTYLDKTTIVSTGAHIFHLSGPDGFRISPQIPSQIDRKERFHRNLFDRNKNYSYIKLFK